MPEAELLAEIKQIIASQPTYGYRRVHALIRRRRHEQGGAQPGAGYRNGYWPGRVHSAEGTIEYRAPQIADRDEPFCSRIREAVRGRTEELEALAVEMCLDDDFEARIAHLKFPLGHRRAIRTTNLLERLFGEARRRTKVIPHAFGERAVLKLVYAALIRVADRWRGIRITAFEQCQLKAIRHEIDNNFTARNAPAASNDRT